jgi:hypothetical protein
MNARQVFAALSVALAGNVAMAVEAEQYEPQSTLSRAEVQADNGRAPVTLLSGGEATQFVIDRPVAPLKSRDEVRTEARQGLVFSELYVA